MVPPAPAGYAHVHNYLYLLLDLRKRSLQLYIFLFPSIRQSSVKSALSRRMFDSKCVYYTIQMY